MKAFSRYLNLYWKSQPYTTTATTTAQQQKQQQLKKYNYPLFSTDTAPQLSVDTSSVIHQILPLANKTSERQHLVVHQLQSLGDYQLPLDAASHHYKHTPERNTTPRLLSAASLSPLISRASFGTSRSTTTTTTTTTSDPRLSSPALQSLPTSHQLSSRLRIRYYPSRDAIAQDKGYGRLYTSPRPRPTAFTRKPTVFSPRYQPRRSLYRRYQYYTRRRIYDKQLPYYDPPEFPVSLLRRLVLYVISLLERMAGLKRAREEAEVPASKRRRVDSSSQPKYYAVRHGRAQGVFHTWADCQAQIVGFKGAVYKSFPTESDAQAFVDGQNPFKAPTSSRPLQEKYYAVARGLKAGIFVNWEETAASIKGAVGPRFKKFGTRAEAMDFMRQYASPEAVKAAEAGLIVSGKSAEQGNLKAEAPSRTKAEPKKQMERTTAAKQGATSQDAAYDDHVQVYTDGSSRGNGRVGAAAGVGVYFGPNDPRNVSERLEGEPQTNQRAELSAILFALQRVPVNRKILIITDSQYSINCATVWARSWAKKNWVSSTGEEVKNQDLVRAIIAQMAAREKAGGVTSFKWVKGHNKNPGNEAADALAVAGAMKPMK